MAVPRNALTFPLAPVALALIAGCGSSTAAVDGAIGPDVPVADANVDARPASLCTGYPVEWPADATAKAAAVAELATLSTTADLTWSDARGTLASVFGLDATLTSCTDGHDVGVEVAAFLTAHPALFQFDASQWSALVPYDCKNVGTSLEILNRGRLTLDGQPVLHDTLAYSIKRTPVGVTLTSVIATYLPADLTGLGARMEACTDADLGAVEAAVRATALPARTYEQCTETGALTYQMKAGDTISVLPGVAWTWDDGDHAVALTGQRTARITLAAANYTPELLASDARCPVGDGADFTIGFDVTFDVHTGEITYIKPGLDCIVC
ncbi:MAG: hypothetical protein K8W52_28730 [Deltaproteobacteria bacterium]|nr:hypothetical protein [Deltaproteobacteria bacterium]